MGGRLSGRGLGRLAGLMDLADAPARTAPLHASHLTLAGSRCLAVQHRPAQAVKGALLMFPALAEELNKTRRATTLAAQSMAGQGWAVLQVDWLGTGDSDGDFGDARWATWLAQAHEARAWWADQHPGRPLLAWGVRGGCLMASALDQVQPWDGQLWWQPVVKGQVHWQHWLRMKLATGLGEAEPRTDLRSLKAATARGEPVDIAGYAFAAEWVNGLLNSELAAPRGPCLWLETRADPSVELPPGVEATVQRWAGAPLKARAVHDRAPWASQELEDGAALQAASLQWLSNAWPG